MSPRAVARRRSPVLARFLVGLVIAAAVAPAPAPAAAQVTGDQAAAGLAEAYGVKVLRVREGEVDGAPVWLVTVMKPGGNANDAFQVTTLAVDQATGELVPTFRQGVHGPVQGGDSFDTQIEKRPEVLRSGPWR